MTIPGVIPLREGAAKNLPPIARDPELLKLMDECSGRWNGHLYETRAEAFTQVLWAHGFQNYAFSKSAAATVDLREYGYSGAAPMNVLLPIVQLQKAIYLARSPKRESYATSRDEADIEAARYALDYLEWEDEFIRIKELRNEAATLLSETGNAVGFAGWDPTGGRAWAMEDGRLVFEGNPIVRIDSMFDWCFHPDAKNYRESPYAYRRTFVSRDWAYEHFPEYAEAIPPGATLSSDSVPVFQRRLLTISPSGVMRTTMDRRAPKDEEFFEFGELYWRSSPKRPLGLMAFAFCQGGQPILIPYVGENPYVDRQMQRRTLPVVHGGQIRRTGSFWFESLMQHALAMQNYINCFEDVIAEVAELMGNPKYYYYENGMSPQQIDNEIGRWIPIREGSEPPGLIPNVVLPPVITEGPGRAMQYLNNLAQPMGPLQQEAEGNVTSGVQQAIVNEGKQLRVGPMMAEWETFWDALTTLRIDNCATFMTMPRKIGVVGHDAGWRETYFSGALASGNFTVKIVEGSTIPLSRSATTAWWIEMFKTPPVQLALQMNPSIMKYFWEDIDKGDIARSMRDPNLHREKARRNIKDVRLGIPRVADPMTDNIPDHVATYQNFMNSAEYVDACAKDPTLDLRMRMLLGSFLQLQTDMMNLMAAQQAQQAQASRPQPGGAMQNTPHAQGGVGASQGGDGGYPRATQGFGRGSSGARDSGGHPQGR